MRLRELRFPIAVRQEHHLIGGRNAGLKSAKKFNFNVAEFYHDGGYDDAIIYDCDGGKYEVDRIELTKPHWIYPFLKRADNLFVLPDRDKTDMVTVDMVLRQVGRVDLETFKRELLDVALSHPNWWKRHSTMAEIESMFDGCDTFAAAIDSIGVLDPPGRQRLPGRSSKVVDLRS